jgi:CBS domain-containing protein
VDARVNLPTFAEDYLLRSGRRCFVVVENGQETGLVSIHELKQIPRARWPYTTVADIARPLDEMSAISPGASVTEVLESMVRHELNQLPVMTNGRLVGVIGRDDIVQYVQTEAELKAA